MRNMIINISIIILCICAIIINVFLDTYEAIGAVCIVLMGVLALVKEKRD